MTNNNQAMSEEQGIGTKSALLSVPKMAEDAVTENRFPYEVFPEPIMEIIEATNKCLGYPVDFIGTSMLYAVSVAIGNTLNIQLKNGWTESAVLYFALVGPPGANKTHPLNFAVKPIRNKDQKSYRAYEEAKKEYDRLLSMTKKERNGAGEPVKPVFQKILVSDFTPESLADVLKYNKRGIGVCMDELAAWINNFNRYNKGSEEQLWLSCWSGQPITIDRKTSDPINISTPFIPIIGSIQNGILNELAKEQRNHTGFMDRILFAMPINLEREYWSELELDPYHTQKWEDIISDILDTKLKLDENMNPVPQSLTLSAEAWEIFVDWHDKNTDLINDSPDAERGIYTKLVNCIARLALIMEVMSRACGENNRGDTKIDAKSMQAAKMLIEYFRGTALNVQEVLSSNKAIDKLPMDKRNLLNKLPQTFTTGQGLCIAEELGMSESTYKRFLNDKELFNKLEHGQYEKIIP